MNLLKIYRLHSSQNQGIRTYPHKNKISKPWHNATADHLQLAFADNSELIVIDVHHLYGKIHKGKMARHIGEK